MPGAPLTKAAALTIAAWLMGANLALASNDAAGLPDVQTAKLLPELAGLLIVATFLESALSTLFNWRVYREFFNSRALKTLVMIGFGYAIVATFHYDVMSRVIGYAGGDTAPNGTSMALSALVLAGGSSAVFELYKRLGLRSPVELSDVQSLPAEDKAWVSVLIKKKNLNGAPKIRINKVESPTAEQSASVPLAGLLIERSIVERFVNLFINRQLRFPPSGGRTVDAGAVYEISVEAPRRVVKDGSTTTEVSTDVIFIGRFAGRAIIDFVVEI